MMQESNVSMVMGVSDLPEGMPVRHPVRLTINSGSVLLFCATSFVVSLAITNGKVAWLARAALAGVIGYAYYEQRQLDKVQVEWFHFGNTLRYADLYKHLATWEERSAESEVVEKKWVEDAVVGDLEEVKFKDSIKGFFFKEKDPGQVAYEEAWRAQLKELKKAFKNAHHYVVGIWKGGWLQSVMLLEYAEGQESSLGTPGGADNVLLLNLITAPWNLRKRQGWGKEVFERGIKGLFPKGITVYCKPDMCQPPSYFNESLKFEQGKEGLLSRSVESSEDLL